MAGVIICGFLKVPFKVLYAFYVFKTEPLIIVYRVMVMHDGCLCGKQLQDIVFNEAAEVLLFMGCIMPTITYVLDLSNYFSTIPYVEDLLYLLPCVVHWQKPVFEYLF